MKKKMITSEMLNPAAMGGRVSAVELVRAAQLGLDARREAELPPSASG